VVLTREKKTFLPELRMISRRGIKEVAREVASVFHVFLAVIRGKLRGSDDFYCYPYLFIYEN